MFVRCSLPLVALLASRASAQGVPREIPGTGDDPIVALGLIPPIVDAPLYPGIAVRGGDPADTRFLFDEFELPGVFHDGRGLRSIVVPAGLGTLTAARDDVDLGRGTTFLSLTPTRLGRTSVEATDLDVTLVTQNRRRPLFAAARLTPGFFEEAPFAVDEVGSVTFRRGADTLSALMSWSTVESLARVVWRSHRHRGAWRLNIAASPMSFRNSDLSRTDLDARVDIEHTAPAAGLRRVTWRAGVDSHNASYDFDASNGMWIADIAGWSSVQAVLSPNIIARGGVRVDAFLRGRDLATQPRGSIEGNFENTRVKLEAGAYRRAPEQHRYELLEISLHPERTSQVTATVSHQRGALLGQIVGYYIDRTHLIVQSPFGELVNTGFGTSKGVELDGLAVHGRWSAYVGASLSSSTHHDYPRAASRPANFDQPLRFDSYVRYTAKRWRIGARFSLSSGLPYTPVIESIYNSDTDSYRPLFGFTNSARLPLHHELDVRADVRIGRRMTAFIDVRNAYAAGTALGYEYSYDYKRRLDVTLPILPFIGIRGDL
ncbi:MAG TPA: TonB-dependent receptor [Kofleriaceae bacterium]|nr:TonB-dependent receptor [Kofleriaceae bacterium]